MRILLDQAVHHHRNKGNNALLEASLDRFRAFWPQASFEVISIAPHLCRICFPHVQPVFPHNLRQIETKLDMLHRGVPQQVWYALFELREVYRDQARLVRKTQPLRLSDSTQLKRTVQLRSHEATMDVDSANDAQPAQSRQVVTDTYENIADYDLYVATGGGYMCDDDKRFLLPLLDRLEAAVSCGVPTVMVGQGVGPLEDAELRFRTRQVLPSLDYIMIREERFARPILDTLGVQSSKVIMTGDDAIELAYLARGNNLGKGIGLSLRVASYTEVSAQHIECIRRVVQQAAKKYGAELVSAPIDANDADQAYIKELMRGYSQTLSSWHKFESPTNVVKRVSRCRLMVTGTFHGAVFALSQGIPVIAVTKTLYQTMKLSGLAAEFGDEGCQIVQLEDPELEKNLLAAIDFAWQSAEQVRSQLLWNAKRQIDLGHEAYKRIFCLVETKRQMSMRLGR